MSKLNSKKLSEFASDLMNGPRHTKASVSRASANDEYIRQRKVKEQRQASAKPHKEGKARIHRTTTAYDKNQVLVKRNHIKVPYTSDPMVHRWIEAASTPRDHPESNRYKKDHNHQPKTSKPVKDGHNYKRDDHMLSCQMADVNIAEPQNLHPETDRYSGNDISGRDSKCSTHEDSYHSYYLEHFDSSSDIHRHIAGKENERSTHPHSVSHPSLHNTDKNDNRCLEHERVSSEVKLEISDQEDGGHDNITQMPDRVNEANTWGTAGPRDSLEQRRYAINDLNSVHQNAKQQDHKPSKERPSSSQSQTSEKKPNKKDKRVSGSVTGMSQHNVDRHTANEQSNVPLQSPEKKSPRRQHVHVPPAVAGRRGQPPRQNRKLRTNIDFYSNIMRSRPAPGHTIEQMLKWRGNYEMLERNHRYIQWLFPIPEGSGMNREAQPLMEHEAEAIRGSDEARGRVLRAYKMMLDFYGMRLQDDLTGLVERSKNWKDRYKHLNKSRHNYLRITRIITALGELGFERYQVPWLDFFFEEILTYGELQNVKKRRCLQYWVFAIKDEGEREAMYRRYLKFFENFESQDEYYDDFDSESEEEEGDADFNYYDFQKGEGHGVGAGGGGGGGSYGQKQKQTTFEF